MNDTKETSLKATKLTRTPNPTKPRPLLLLLALPGNHDGSIRFTPSMKARRK